MILRYLAQFNARADWSFAAADYVKRHSLDLVTVQDFAGLIAIWPCLYDGNGGFEFDDTSGEMSVIIEVLGEDGKTVIDLCAWPVTAPERFATAVGCDALGLSQVTNAATYAFDRALLVHRTPLAWLQHDCNGVVILDHRHVAYWLGRALGPIRGEDLSHAQQLHAMLNPRFEKSRIQVPVFSEGRAA
jgi:hypothetical protein